MRWWIVLIVACGSNESTPEPSPPEATTMETTMATIETSMETSMNETTMEVTMEASASAMTVAPSEPTEVPEELRASHDRLVARIEANMNDVPSICALASVLRRAEMYSAADARLTEAFRIAQDSTLDLELPEGTIEACHYESGRVSEAQEDWASALDSYWRAMKTPIERRRRIVEDAFFRVAKSQYEDDCGAGSTLGIRSLLSLKDDPVFRRCLREREQLDPTCLILRLDDPAHPGTRESNFDSYATVGDDGAAFGIIGDALYVISVIRGRKQVRQCAFDLPEDSRISFPRVLRLGENELFYLSTTSVISYTCECEEGEEGHELSPHDCRCSDSCDIRFVFTDRGELRLALIDDYSTEDGMPGVTWDEPHLRESISGGPSIDGEVLRIGRSLKLRTHVLVPAD